MGSMILLKTIISEYIADDSRTKSLAWEFIFFLFQVDNFKMITWHLLKK